MSNITKSITAKKAQSIIDDVNSCELIEGQKWYLLSKEWWRSFVNSQDKCEFDPNAEVKMPPITNADLVKDSNCYKLKEGLLEGVNYILVPEEQFTLLTNLFGIENKERDEIIRSVIIGAFDKKSPFVEVYPLRLKFAKIDKPTDIRLFEVSNTSTFDEIKEKAFDLLGINADQRSSLRVLVEVSDNEFESTENLSSSLPTILKMDIVFYIVDKSVNLKGGSGQSCRLETFAKEQSNISGLCGLQNLGHTCFMNSALQCLSNIPILTDYFLSDKLSNEINKTNMGGTGGKLANAYRELVKKMWTGNYVSVKPFEVKCVIGTFAPRFNGYAEQDSQELMAFLLDGLHEDLNRVREKPYIEESDSSGRPDNEVANEAWQNYKKRNDSIIIDLMHGQLKSTLECNICGKISIKFDPFCFLSVPVPKEERKSGNSTNEDLYTLEECIEMFTKREQLDENESWYCSQCKTHQQAFKQLNLWKLPEILIVHLKRFQCTRYERGKIENDIIIPVKNFKPISGVSYDLIAISDHLGGLASGHYSAKALLKTNQKWCEFKDAKTSILGDIPDPLISRGAYILIYKRNNL